MPSNTKKLRNRVVFVTKYKEGIAKYRSDLASKLITELPVRSMGKAFFFFKAILFWPANDIVITSDGRVNLLGLLTGAPQLIILNGLGRFEKSKIVRSLLLRLINRKQNLRVCVQSYRDYRYFRKLTAAKIKWVPGSGGQKRATGLSLDPIFVTRDDKFKYTQKSLLEVSVFLNNIYVLGLKTKKTDSSKLTNLGIQMQDNLFCASSTFLQLDGYGEGVPHSLVDAICSNMNLIIDKKCWVKFGLNKISTLRPDKFVDDPNFYMIKAGSKILQSLERHLNLQVITGQYASEFKKLIEVDFVN